MYVVTSIHNFIKFEYMYHVHTLLQREIPWYVHNSYLPISSILCYEDESKHHGAANKLISEKEGFDHTDITFASRS